MDIPSITISLLSLAVATYQLWISERATVETHVSAIKLKIRKSFDWLTRWTIRLMPFYGSAMVAYPLLQGSWPLSKSNFIMVLCGMWTLLVWFVTIMQNLVWSSIRRHTRIHGYILQGTKAATKAAVIFAQSENFTPDQVRNFKKVISDEVREWSEKKTDFGDESISK